MEEKKAIAEACKNDEIAENWVDIVVFYVPPKDSSYETKLEAIQKAHKLWRANEGLTDKPADDQGKKDTAELAGDKGLNKGKEKTDQQPERKSIIPKKEKMTDWYK
jgi:RNA polymerase subunit RPABC4/transcription elongation factor Spt4